MHSWRRILMRARVRQKQISAATILLRALLPAMRKELGRQSAELPDTKDHHQPQCAHLQTTVIYERLGNRDNRDVSSSSWQKWYQRLLGRIGIFRRDRSSRP